VTQDRRREKRTLVALAPRLARPRSRQTNHSLPSASSCAERFWGALVSAAQGIPISSFQGVAGRNQPLLPAQDQRENAHGSIKALYRSVATASS
jgi:hypothetical protein